MKAVGIKQLKAKLSEYVRLAKAGDTILVTDREEIVAELRPARRQPYYPESLEEVLDSLAGTGEVTRASLPKEGWTWKSRGLDLPARTARRLIEELREDS
ncbi:MAG TPA: prevent-host-death protein [Acidobacteriota bacterium]|jgi:antitoxin (DNA-binding transcriptional repressor) of toxin-antitoxin stability system